MFLPCWCCFASAKPAQTVPKQQDNSLNPLCFTHHRCLLGRLLDSFRTRYRRCGSPGRGRGGRAAPGRNGGSARQRCAGVVGDDTLWCVLLKRLGIVHAYKYAATRNDKQALLWTIHTSVCLALLTAERCCHPRLPDNQQLPLLSSTSGQSLEGKHTANLQGSALPLLMHVHVSAFHDLHTMVLHAACQIFPLLSPYGFASLIAWDSQDACLPTFAYSPACVSGAGLSEAEAAARLAQHGPNRMTKAAPPSHLALLAAALMQARHLTSSGVYPLCVSMEATQSPIVNTSTQVVCTPLRQLCSCRVPRTPVQPLGSPVLSRALVCLRCGAVDGESNCTGGKSWCRG